MATRLLVVYGTTEGHTRKVAGAMRETLHGLGAQTDVVSADEAPSPDPYDAVIVAASVHGGQYQRAVRRWVRTHAETLAGKPSAFVSVCLGVLEHDEKTTWDLRDTVDRFLASTGWRPGAVKLVAGALPYTHYSWLTRFIMKRIVAKAGGDTDTTRDYEYTDWKDLRQFVTDFAGRLGAPSVAPVRVASAVAVAVALALVLPAVAAAQSGGSSSWRFGTTLSGFAGVAVPDSKATAVTGAAVGWEVTPHFAVEGSGAWIGEDHGSDAFAAALTGRISMAPARAAVPFLAAGVGMYREMTASGGSAHDRFLTTVGGGADLFVSEHFALRPEVSVLLVNMPSTTRAVPLYLLRLAYHFESHRLHP
jgi:menaquinone-dependent protoporphyrinogen oxidase